MRKTLTVVAVLVVLAVIGAGAVHFFNSNQTQEKNNLGEPAPESGGVEAPAQPDWCPRVEVISAPGTWESKA
ncbi:carbohydrate esterase, partial [Corynebacterium striatum]